MATKVNLSKAYDSLEWYFIKDTLKYFGIRLKLGNLIMSCITTSTSIMEWPTGTWFPSF